MLKPMRSAAAHYDVIVAGAGLVGASFALALAQASCNALSIAVVEAQPAPSAPLPAAPFSARVVAINEASRRLLDRIGVWDRVGPERRCPYRRMEVWDHEGTGSIRFDAAEVRAPDLGHIVETRALTAALAERLAAAPAVQQYIPARIEHIRRRGGGIVLDVAGTELSAKLLVAADGARSPVREQLGFRVREWSYGHSAIVATIRTEIPHALTARQWFGAAGPLALLPLGASDGDHHLSAVVWSQQTAVAQALMALDAEAFGAALATASEHCLGRVAVVAAPECLPLRQCHAIDYLQRGVVLIGDAAHSIHPLAGQGVNLGLADATVLAEELARAQVAGADLGERAILGRYQRRRVAANLAAMAAMEGLQRVFEHRSPLLRVLRNHGMTWLDSVQAVKRLLVRQAMGL